MNLKPISELVESLEPDPNLPIFSASLREPDRSGYAIETTSANR